MIRFDFTKHIHQPGMLGDFGMIPLNIHHYGQIIIRGSQIRWISYCWGMAPPILTNISSWRRPVKSTKPQQGPSLSIAKYPSGLMAKSQFFTTKSVSFMTRSTVFQLNPWFFHVFFTKDLPLGSVHRCITDPKKCDVSLQHHKCQGEGHGLGEGPARRPVVISQV